VTDIRLTEPTTMLTDYVLAALAISFAARIWLRAAGADRRKVGLPAGAPAGLWCFAFAAIALAALAGGTAHGFRLYLGDTAHARLWQATVALITLSTLLTLAAAIRSVLRPSIAAGPARRAGHRWLKRGLYATLVGVAIQQSGCGFHTHFNHNDLYHVVQMAGLYCLYRGARLLEALETPDPA
jgi:hypothetical protein